MWATTLLCTGLCLGASLALAAHPNRARAEVRRIATELDRPVFVTAPPGDSQRIFIVLQRGQILVLNLADDSINATPFLSLSGLAAGNEQGLLGLAFHPDYAANGLFYVNYTETSGRTVIAEYRVSANPDVAFTGETRLLTIGQPAANHNGGWIGFGPDDGDLYIATGDGGGMNDDGFGHTVGLGNGQDITNNLLGKILRIDVDVDDFPADPGRNYGIPATNPFVGLEGDDEIWSYGLRNPYRASFDRESGDLYIGDVGQGAREEIDVQPAGSGGFNFGWRLREGTIETPDAVGGNPPDGAIDPIFDYLHDGGGFQGCSVTGGVVYRGPIDALDGTYFFADFCTGELWSLRFDGSVPADYDGTNFSDLTDHTGDPDFTPDVGSLAAISSFGEDDAGNLYIVKLGTPPDSGEIFVLPEPAGSWGALACLATVALLRRARRPAAASD